MIEKIDRFELYSSVELEDKLNELIDVVNRIEKHINKDLPEDVTHV